MIEIKKDITSVWVLQPKLKTELKDRDNSSSIGEAKALAKALPYVKIVGSSVIPIERISPKQFFGSGKIGELSINFKLQKIDLVVINSQISPVQQRNLEKIYKIKILDKTSLILEIFGERAFSKIGSIQVELAHLSWQKSRLVRSWTHLERQRGGFGFLGGPGESQIELDKRMINKRIKQLKYLIFKATKTREIQYNNRQKKECQ